VLLKTCSNQLLIYVSLTMYLHNKRENDQKKVDVNQRYIDFDFSKKELSLLSVITVLKSYIDVTIEN